MAIAETATPRFEIGRVVKRAFGVIPDNIAAFALLSVIPGLSSATLEWGQNQLRPPALLLSPPGSGTIALLVGAGVAYFVSWFILQAAVVHGAVASFNGRRASVGDCIATGFRRLVPLVLIGAIATLAILAAALLLLVPGIMVAVMWFVVVPVCVVEHTGIGDSLNRSSELTRGYRWPIFWMCVAYFVALIVLMVLFGGLLGVSLAVTSNEELLSLEGPTLFIGLAFDALTTMISAIFLSTLIASTYYELRQIKEGIGPEALASVFD